MLFLFFRRFEGVEDLKEVKNDRRTTDSVIINTLTPTKEDWDEMLKKEEVIITACWNQLAPSIRELLDHGPIHEGIYEIACVNAYINEMSHKT